MPKYAIYYTTTTDWYVEIEADSFEEAHKVWDDEAYWTTEPEPVREFFDDSIDVLEIGNDDC